MEGYPLKSKSWTSNGTAKHVNFTSVENSKVLKDKNENDFKKNVIMVILNVLGVDFSGMVCKKYLPVQQ